MLLAILGTTPNKKSFLAQKSVRNYNPLPYRGKFGKEE